MANKLSSRDRELLYTHTDRIIGERPYEAGEFKLQDRDFILFELLDISGRIILHKNLKFSSGEYKKYLLKILNER